MNVVNILQPFFQSTSLASKQLFIAVLPVHKVENRLPEFKFDVVLSKVIIQVFYTPCMLQEKATKIFRDFFGAFIGY
jgi:hypothetical protein